MHKLHQRYMRKLCESREREREGGKKSQQYTKYIANSENGLTEDKLQKHAYDCAAVTISLGMVTVRLPDRYYSGLDVSLRYISTETLFAQAGLGNASCSLFSGEAACGCRKGLIKC